MGHIVAGKQPRHILRIGVAAGASNHQPGTHNQTSEHLRERFHGLRLSLSSSSIVRLGVYGKHPLVDLKALPVLKKTGSSTAERNTDLHDVWVEVDGDG